MTGGYYNFETLEGLREIAIVQLQWTEERRGRGPLLRWLTRAADCFVRALPSSGPAELGVAAFIGATPRSVDSS